MITMQESDIITVTISDGSRLALLFSVDSDPLHISAARLARYPTVPRRQAAVRRVRPTEKVLIERVGRLLHTGLAGRAPLTYQEAEQCLADLVDTVNRNLARRQRSEAAV
ncbi:hypothetical protein [Streptomyces sp. 4F14]|uniref:hypothetical protein n=1 Tax=Streptomyces sp. 4F14 TaxID=3394380 RepID=UPI003A890888